MHGCSNMGNQTMIQIALSEASEKLNGVLEQSAGDYVILMKDGRPIGAVIGFADEDDWFDFQLEHDPRFLRRIARARAQAEAGKTIRLEDLPE